MNEMIPMVGSVVRFGPWNGVVLDIFTSEASGQHILQIMFAKNVYKQQPAELHVLEDLREGLLVSSTREALEEELARYRDSAAVEADKLLEKVVSSVETPSAEEAEARA